MPVLAHRCKVYGSGYTTRTTLLPKKAQSTARIPEIQSRVFLSYSICRRRVREGMTKWSSRRGPSYTVCTDRPSTNVLCGRETS
jgi:hypothetical protein